MTDSLKLAEMQRTSIDFERQRHIANWFIKSGPHMATPSPPSLNINGGTKNGTITTTATGNPLFFVVSTGQIKHQPIPPSGIGVQTNPNGCTSPGGTVSISTSKTALSRSQVITQDNFPLQIVTTSASSQDGGRRKSKLRRFNSHDTSANMFSVADFENARLARRNEIEMKQRQQQRLKMNSLSSGGDCSTGDSKGSRYSNESQTEPLSAEIFLDRYSLPRIVRISYKQKFSHETLQSSSSNGSSTTQSSSGSLIGKSDGVNKQNGELFLLYRHLRQRYVYHGFNTKTGLANRKKGVMIPQEFPGYFSLINDKGLPAATQYTSLIQLVRERVHKFISVDSLPAFTESQSTTNTPEGFVSSRPHYVKSTARGGQIFRLLAVFEDGNQQDSKFSSSFITSGSSSSSGRDGSGREKEKGRYAQLFNENRQILYVSLTAKGKFYEIEPSIPQILQKVSSIPQQTNLENNLKQRKLNPDCVHRISSLISPDKEFPINLKFISASNGASGSSSSNSSSVSIPENITITHVTKENIIVACPIDDVSAAIDSGQTITNLQLKKLPVTNEMTFMKCLLGFENEQRMLSNPNVQNILKFCQFNCDQFLKQVELELFSRPERSTSKSRVDGLKKLKPLNFPRLLRREKTTIAHEKEDSIIFLSKNDLANLEAKQEQRHTQQQQQQQQQQLSQSQNTSSSDQQQQSQNTSIFSDKMKVFQSTKKKWFKRNEKNTTMTCLDIDIQAKRMSMQRYNDMSKLLQERFGEEILAASSNSSNTSPSENSKSPPHPSGSIRITNGTNSADRNLPSFTNGGTITNQKKLQKSLSLQDVDLIDKQPDLVPSNFNNTETTTLAESMTSISSGFNGPQQNLNPFIEDLKTPDELKNSIRKNIFSENGEGNSRQQPKQFISEKMYSEFHVKTKQYSKSSSSLHQLLHFAVPQKMNVVEMKKQKTSNASGYLNKNENDISLRDLDLMNNSKQIDFLIGDPVSINCNSDDFSSTTIIDDLPYSSVRDSLLVSESTAGNSTSGTGQHGYHHGGYHPDPNFSSIMISGSLINNNDLSYPSNCNSCIINGSINTNPSCQNRTSLNATTSGGGNIINRVGNNNLIEIFDDTKENIYAEICPSNADSSNGGSYNEIETAGVAISRIQIDGNSNDDQHIQNNTKKNDRDEELNYPEIIIKGASVVQATASYHNNRNSTANNIKPHVANIVNHKDGSVTVENEASDVTTNVSITTNTASGVLFNDNVNDLNASDVGGAGIDNIYNTLK